VLRLLLASTAINVGFLIFDPRMMQVDLLSGAALLAGGAAYVVALPFVHRDRSTGYFLTILVAILASAVVLADNVSAFGSTPNVETYALNLTLFLVQVPLVAACVYRLRIPAAL
jgi:uncharacterized membrane protein YiaA